MTLNRLKKNYIELSKVAIEDMATAKILLKQKRYGYCLLFCQQSLEKFLKAYYICYFQEFPPYTHDLKRLARYCKIPTPDYDVEMFKSLSNLYKKGKYQQEQLVFTDPPRRLQAQNWYNRTAELTIWLKQEIEKR